MTTRTVELASRLSLVQIRRIDELCDRLEVALREGGRPDLARYVLDWPPPVRAVLLRELLLVCVDHHERCGERVAREFFYDCLPEDRGLVDSVFDEIASDVNYPTSRFASDATNAARPMTTSSDATPTSRPKIGRYCPIREIGRGAFGIVHLARDSELNRFVAIKQPHGERLPSHETWAAFRREAELAAKLQHPAIVTIHDIGLDTGGTPYIVMEYIRGVSLRDELKRKSLLPLKAAQLLAQVADGLQHAHEAGIVHRDLKPGNLLLDGEGNPHIADLGLACHVGQNESDRGQLAGTYAYMAPEQVRGNVGEVDSRCDIWAMGIILHEMLIGLRPFAATKIDRLFDQILHADVVDPTELGQEIPPTLWNICQRCLAKAPSDRFTSAGEVAGELRHWIETETEKQTEVASSRSARRWPVAAAAAVVAIIVLGFAASHGPPRPKSSATLTSTDSAYSDKLNQDDNAAPMPSYDSAFRIAGRAERFSTLAQAVLAASDGDTIEVFGDGRYSSSAIEIQDKALVIQAAKGSAPTLVLDDSWSLALLKTNSNLTLCGLELRRHSDLPARPPNQKPSLVHISRADFRARSCRFHIDGRERNACVVVDEGSDLVTQSCTFRHEGCGGVFWKSSDDGRMLIEECNFQGGAPINVTFESGRVPTVQVSRSEITAEEAAFVLILRDPLLFLESTDAQRLRIDVFDTQFRANLLVKLGLFGQGDQTFTQTDAFKLLSRSVSWSNRGCTFAIRDDYLALTGNGLGDMSSGITNVDQWNRLWEPASISKTPNGRLTESAVTWQQSNVPFSVSGSGECYGTLSEAVATASDGQTIEIHGEGPYVTDLITVHNKSLVIRAARGFRPVLDLADSGSVSMFRTDSELTLEGLELRRSSRLPWAPGRKPSIIASTGSSLTARNCRFAVDSADRKTACIFADDTRCLEFVDCQFDHDACEGVFWRPSSASLCLVNNCVFEGSVSLFVGYGPLTVPKVAVTNSTLTAQHSAFVLRMQTPPTFLESPKPNCTQIAMTDSTVHASTLLTLAMSAEFTEDELPVLLNRSVAWSDQRCDFAIVEDFLIVTTNGRRQTNLGIRNVQEWNKLWQATDTSPPRE